MRIDAVYSGPLKGVLDAARSAKAAGYNGMWVTETAHDPFLQLMRAAEVEGLDIGTAIAVALSRSPMTMAQTAWDLQRYSDGRLWLGLGSQVKAHITRRFSMPWDKPVEQMREFMGALRAIWNTFQTNAPLQFDGQYYKLSLMSPFFNPGPIDHPQIPIGLSAVGPAMTRLAGEVADFVVLHPFTTLNYLESVTKPSLDEGLRKAGRARESLTVVGSLFVITGDDRQQASMEAQARKSIAFYGSTPAYSGVLELLGQGELHKELHRLSKVGQWGEMSKLITDDLLEKFALRAPQESLAQAIAARFGDHYQRVIFNQDAGELAALSRGAQQGDSASALRQRR